MKETVQEYINELYKHDYLLKELCKDKEFDFERKQIKDKEIILKEFEIFESEKIKIENCFYEDRPAWNYDIFNKIYKEIKSLFYTVLTSDAILVTSKYEFNSKKSPYGNYEQFTLNCPFSNLIYDVKCYYSDDMDYWYLKVSINYKSI